MSTQALSPVTDDQAHDLDRWRAMALQRMPYLSTMMFSVRPLNAPGLATFAVDPQHRLYVDFDGVREWGDDACSQVLLHEVLHLWQRPSERLHRIVGNDTTRQDATDSNIAADAEINDDLAEAGCDHIATTGVQPSSFGAPVHHTYEEYFAILRSLRQQQPGSGAADADPSGGSSDAGQSARDAMREYAQGLADGLADRVAGVGHGDDGSQHGQSGTAGNPDYEQGYADAVSGQIPSCGSGAGGLRMPVELDAADSMNGQANPASPSEIERIMVQQAHEIVDHHKNQGHVPAGLVADAELNLRPPTVPWQSVLQSACRRGIGSAAGRDDYTYTRPNRRYSGVTVGGGTVIFPGTHSPQPVIAVVRDTSGSMDDHDLNDVNSEIVGIATRCGVTGKNLVVLDVDADVSRTERYRSQKTLATIGGRGGTDMRVGIHAALNLSPRPTVCIVLTDGFTDWPPQPVKGMAVIACLVGEPSMVEQARQDIPAWIRVVVVPRNR